MLVFRLAVLATLLLRQAVVLAQPSDSELSTDSELCDSSSSSDSDSDSDWEQEVKSKTCDPALGGSAPCACIDGTFKGIGLRKTVKCDLKDGKWDWEDPKDSKNGKMKLYTGITKADGAQCDHLVELQSVKQFFTKQMCDYVKKLPKTADPKSSAKELQDILNSPTGSNKFVYVNGQVNGAKGTCVAKPLCNMKKGNARRAAGVESYVTGTKAAALTAAGNVRTAVNALAVKWKVAGGKGLPDDFVTKYEAILDAAIKCGKRNKA